VSDIDQIKTHLIKLRNDGSYGPWLDAAILAMDNFKVAADEIERLRAENQSLSAALRLERGGSVELK